MPHQHCPRCDATFHTAALLPIGASCPRCLRRGEHIPLLASGPARTRRFSRRDEALSAATRAAPAGRVDALPPAGG
jgi:hypothetical protein